MELSFNNLVDPPVTLGTNVSCTEGGYPSQRRGLWTRSTRPGTSTSSSPPWATQGLYLATWAGGTPGVASVMTHYKTHKMDQLDIPSIPEFIEMIADTGAGLYGCKA